MAESAQEIKTNTTDVEGLEHIFVSTVDPVIGDSRSTADPGWTLTQTANEHNVTERTVRRWIKEQRIDAWKVDGPRGPEWRIHPGSSPDIQPDHSGSTLSIASTSPALETMAEIIKDLAGKLAVSNEQVTAATYRNGYLEAQLEAQREQIKLLTDSQHRPGWWGRFSDWFLGTTGRVP